MIPDFLDIKTCRTVEDKAEKFRFIIILLFTFSLPYSITYSSILLILLTLLTILEFKFRKLEKIPKEVGFFLLIYLLGVLGYFYSFHKAEAGFLLERQLALLIFPVLIPFAITIDKRKVELVLQTLAISSSIAMVFLFFNLFLTIKMQIRLPLVNTVFSGAFFNHQFSKPLAIHAGYLSLYVSLSIIYLVQSFNANKSIKVKMLLVCGLLVLFLGLFFLASRNSVISTFFILLVVYPLLLVKKKTWYLLFSLILLVISFLAANRIPYLKERFSNELISDIRPLSDGTYLNYSSAEPRIERWKGALELVKKSPIFGYGTGDEVAMLKTEYIKRDLFISYMEEFNSHNQYLSYLLKNGMFGLIVFLFAFGYYCYLAIKCRDFVYFSFLLLLLIGFYTENILDANKGILFFALFNTLFGYNAIKSKASSSEINQTITQS